MTTIQASRLYFSARRQLQQKIVATILLNILIRQLQSSLWGESGMNLPEAPSFDSSIWGGSGMNEYNTGEEKPAKPHASLWSGDGCADTDATIGAEPLTR